MKKIKKYFLISVFTLSILTVSSYLISSCAKQNTPQQPSPNPDDKPNQTPPVITLKQINVQDIENKLKTNSFEIGITSIQQAKTILTNTKLQEIFGINSISNIQFNEQEQTISFTVDLNTFDTKTISSNSDKLNINVLNQQSNQLITINSKTNKLFGDSILNPIDEIKNGGTYNNLIVDSFLPIIQDLNLSSEIIIDKNIVNSLRLTDPNFSKLKLEIYFANTEQKVLKLKLLGSYKNISIPDNTIITIQNFYFPDFKSSYSDFNLDIDWNLVFENLQDDNSIKNWTQDDLKQYIKMFNVISKNNQDINVLNLIKNNNLIIDKIEINNELILTTINTSFINYDYQNGAWTETEKSILFYNGKTLLKYSKQQVLDFLIKYKVNKKNLLNKSSYASYYISYLNSIPDTPLENFMLDFNPKYKNKYCPNGFLKYESISYSSNNLILSAKLIDNDNNGNEFAQNDFIFTDLKSSINFVNEQINNPSYCLLKDQNTKNKILKDIKSKNIVINDIAINSSKTIEYKNHFSLKNEMIFDSSKKNNEFVFDNQKYDYFLFNQNILDKIKHNIFDNLVGITNIYKPKLNLTNVISKIKKISNNSYVYEQNFVLQINFSDNTQTEIQANFIFQFLESEYNNIQ